MITIKTGVPGSGKSHSAVAELLALHRYWCTEKGAKERRIVYVRNIPDLAIPHWDLPMLPDIKDRFGEVISCAVDWSKVEKGSLVIIDEAKDTFPARGINDRMPPHVTWLTQHRHSGIDLVIISQHPKLLDTALRRLAGKHQHYRRMFGWGKASVYEWDHCDDGLQYRNAIISTYSYSAKVNAAYKSAEIHTKHKFKKPWWMWVPIAMVPLAVWAIPNAVHILRDQAAGKPLYSAAKVLPVNNGVVGGAPAPGPAAPASGASGGLAVPPNWSASAPAKDEPKFSGCIQVREYMRCYDTQGMEFAKAVPNLTPPPVMLSTAKPPENQGIPAAASLADGEVLALMRSRAAP